MTIPVDEQISLEQPLATPTSNYHGSVLGTMTALSSSAPFASSLSSLLGSSLAAPFLPTLLHPNFANAQINPTPAPPRIPVGATKKPTPLTKLPIAVPDTAAIRAPVAAYLAYRTTRQKTKRAR